MKILNICSPTCVTMMQRNRKAGNILVKFHCPINSCCWFSFASLFSASLGPPKGHLNKEMSPLGNLTNKCPATTN